MRCSPVANAPRARRSRVLLPALLPLTLLLLSACRSGPPPTLYLLEPVVVEALPAQRPGNGTLGVVTVSLPAYAADERIVTRRGAGIVQDDGNRWAEAPDQAITRLLADRLRRLGGATVLVEPLPRGFDPDVRVEVLFDKLLRDASGGAEMSGQVRVLRGDGRGLVAVRPFSLQRAADGVGYEGWFRAVSAGVSEIAVIALDARAAR